MNGFAEHGLDEDAFGEKRSVTSQLRTFDAFPKTKPTYTSASRRGGQWTVLTLVFCSLLALSELRAWYKGSEFHHFSVEKGVSRELQFNIDMVVRVTCNDLIVDVHDASGDNVLAGSLLTKEATNWDKWADDGWRGYQTLHQEDTERLEDQAEDQHVGHVLSEVRRNSKKKFPKGPKLKASDKKDSCRFYGSLLGNKVQGSLHVSSKEFGPLRFGKQQHESNFSHLINELSFGPHYSSLMNPLDQTASITSDTFKKYQYYLSVVPTIYTKSKIVDPYTKSLPEPSMIAPSQRKNTIFTNQYAATSHSRTLPAGPFSAPGIFFRYNIEPILLVVSEERGSLFNLAVRLVNVASGVLVAGGWLYQMSSWSMEAIKRRRGMSEGVLTGKHAAGEDE